MNKWLTTIKNTEFAQKFDGFCRSKYFVILFGLFVFICNTFGLDMWYYRAVFVFGLTICLTNRDYRAWVAIIPMCYIVASWKNNPIYRAAMLEQYNYVSVFLRKETMAEIITYGVILVAVIITVAAVEGRLKGFFNLKEGFFKPCLVILGVTFMTAGLGYSYSEELANEADQYFRLLEQGYIIKNLAYGAGTFVCYSACYWIFRTTVDWATMKKDHIFFVGFVMLCVLAGEVFVQYLTNQNVFMYVTTVEGVEKTVYCGLKEALRHWNDSIGINRSAFRYGWGVYNNIGGMMVTLLPCPFYLACKRKRGYVYNLVGFLLFAMTVLSMSRQAVLMGTIIYLICAVVVLASAENKKANLITYVLLACGLLVVGYLNLEFITDFFRCWSKGDGFFDDSGRFTIWKSGLVLYKHFPIFGTGYFAIKKVIETSITGRFHNTVVQVMASCGTVGLIAYAWHRCKTCMIVFTRPNLEKTVIGLCLLGLVLVSLLDCHTFNFGPMLTYSTMLAFLEHFDENPKNEKFFFQKPLCKKKNLTDANLKTEE